MTHRILIVRLSAIGDVILSLPIACALRRSFPDAHISWIVQGSGSKLLAGHPAIDEILTIPRLTARAPVQFLASIKKARTVHPTVTIDAQGLAKSALLGYFSGAKTRIGFAPNDFEGREGSRWLNNRLVQPKSQHVTLRGLELLRPLGIENPTVEYRMPEFEGDRSFAMGVRESCASNGPFALVNVGAGWVSKLWPAERYAAVATHLYKKWGLPSLILWSGPDEERTAKQVVEMSPICSVIAPSTSLTQLRSLIRLAKIYVGSDTGPTHLSVAVDTPTVGLIGPMPVERVGPMGEYHRAVQNLKLSPLDRSKRKTEMAPMLSISVESVCDACDSILGSRQN